MMCTGDPTVFGNLPPAPNIAAAVKKVIDEGKHSGYGHSRGKPCSMLIFVHMHYIQETCSPLPSGLPKARAALARKYSVVNGAPLTEEVLTTVMKLCVYICMYII